MPTNGPLLSAIWPLFPFVLASIAAVREEDRDFIRSIYDIFCSIARGVSQNLPTTVSGVILMSYFSESDANLDGHTTHMEVDR
jgi:hypothetical protein